MIRTIFWCYVAMLTCIGTILFFMMEGCTAFPPQNSIDGIYDHPNANLTIPLQHQE